MQTKTRPQETSEFELRKSMDIFCIECAINTGGEKMDDRCNTCSSISFSSWYWTIETVQFCCRETSRQENLM